MTPDEIIKQLNSLSNVARAKSAMRFFKSTSTKEDQFIGIAMPILREQVKKFKPLSLSVCVQLLHSPVHEIRMFALLTMVDNFKRSDDAQKTEIYRTYLDNSKWVNNWDLVDCSCYFIVGPYLEKTSRDDLYRLARSSSLWEKRIAIVATLHFIRLNDFTDTFTIADILLADQENLIHKAVGWMLKEVGKRDKEQLKTFLESRYPKMPRMMLRTAIEKFSKDERYRYLIR